MHNDVKFDPIQGQGQGPLEVEISAIFKVHLLLHLSYGLANESVLVFVSGDFEHGPDRGVIGQNFLSSDFDAVWYVDRGR